MRPTLSVFFDGSCPMCVREVAVYRRQSPADILWNNLSQPGLSIPCDRLGYRPDPATLMQRFHVFSSEGRWLHGAPAFALLWARLGRSWRTLALIGRVPGGLWVMDTVYSLFLRARPRLQQLVRHLVREQTLPAQMIPALRSDHAGETGAVWIYRMMLALQRDPGLRPLLEEHAAQERQHLDAFNALLPWRHRSRLLVLWRIAGAVTGAVAALGGQRWTLATIAAVERFVDRHYLEQIEALQQLIDARIDDPITRQTAISDCSTGWCAPESPDSQADRLRELLSLLVSFRNDECRHRDDATRALDDQTAPGLTDPSAQLATPGERSLRAWCMLVERGSAIAVRAAKLI
jgi:demethoxyubiquinone hydroxylase (CLK1/Coq7/Cat5 family)/predicted DCC family thiol-disulfide oxidoreductase YuxK